MSTRNRQPDTHVAGVVEAPLGKTRTWKIAVLRGDGIGAEVTEEALKVLEEVGGRLPGVAFELEEHSAGAAEYLRHGNPLCDRTIEVCRSADAVLLGAMGLPSVRWPGGREITPQIDLREKLDLYAGVRPIRLYHQADTPLKRYQAGEIDLVVVRESTEGLFSARLSQGAEREEATDVMRLTRKGTERICRAAFKIAQQRRGLLTLVDKANVLPSMVYFRSIFEEVAAEFPDVRTEKIYVDAAALYLVQKPHVFDVIVTENMFGDILSDLAAGLVGGVGMAPAADLGEGLGVFQPLHGSAPDLAGKGVANPIAAILSAGLMLEWLEEPRMLEGVAMIRLAVETVLADPANRTPDLNGKLTTREMGDLVVQALGTGAP